MFYAILNGSLVLLVQSLNKIVTKYFAYHTNVDIRFVKMLFINTIDLFAEWMCVLVAYL